MLRKLCDPASPLFLLLCLTGVFLVSARFWAETPDIRVLQQQAQTAASRKDYSAAALYEKILNSTRVFTKRVPTLG